MSNIKAVLQRALSLIRERGWGTSFCVAPDCSLNIRTAVQLASMEIVGGGWYPTNVAALQAVTNHLQEGICAWEFGTKSGSRERRQDEVEAALEAIINRLETRENEAGHSRGRSGADAV